MKEHGWIKIQWKSNEMNQIVPEIDPQWNSKIDLIWDLEIDLKLKFQRAKKATQNRFQK